MLERLTPAGLLSEDTDFETGELWGNYPQTYSLVGLINCAVLCRGRGAPSDEMESSSQRRLGSQREPAPALFTPRGPSLRWGDEVR
jgi:hypothetical protein